MQVVLKNALEIGLDLLVNAFELINVVEEDVARIRRLLANQVVKRLGVLESQNVVAPLGFEGQLVAFDVGLQELPVSDSMVPVLDFLLFVAVLFLELSQFGDELNESSG